MRKEPAVMFAVVAAILCLVVLLVLDRDLSGDAQAALVGGIVLLAGVLTRQNVTPV